MTFDPRKHLRGQNPVNTGQFSASVHAEAEVHLDEPDAGPAVGSWPPHSSETRPWKRSSQKGVKEDRMLSEVTVSLPPMIADVSPIVDASTAADLERALQEIVALDVSDGSSLGALGTLLLRTESIASSKIEHVEASLDDYARALHGIKANSSAVSMAAATVALDSMVNEVSRTGLITLPSLTSAHSALMKDDRYEADYAGRIRDVQNWIGGSDNSPRNALYVPPPPQTLDDYMMDLTRFSNRDNLPVLMQAAIAHAQFESIHPFTDGNGRIGRALINTILRRRGATTRVVVPLASALVVSRERYFDALNAYREGNLTPLLSSFAWASQVAAEESRHTATRLIEIPQLWHDAVGSVRAGSAVEALLRLLPSNPIVSSDQACQAIAAPASSVYAAIDRLREATVLRPLTDRKRNQVWGAGAVLDELDDLNVRIGAAAR